MDEQTSESRKGVGLTNGDPSNDLSQDDCDRIGEASKDWGVVGWLANGLLDHMISASSCVSAHQCAQLLGDRYARISGELPRKLMQLDNTSKSRIEDLRSYSFLWFEQVVTQLDELVQRVKTARQQWQSDGGVSDDRSL